MMFSIIGLQLASYERCWGVCREWTTAWPQKDCAAMQQNIAAQQIQLRLDEAVVTTCGGPLHPWSAQFKRQSSLNGVGMQREKMGERSDFWPGMVSIHWTFKNSARCVCGKIQTVYVAREIDVTIQPCAVPWMGKLPMIYCSLPYDTILQPQKFTFGTNIGERFLMVQAKDERRM